MCGGVVVFLLVCRSMCLVCVGLAIWLAKRYLAVREYCGCARAAGGARWSFSSVRLSFPCMQAWHLCGSVLMLLRGSCACVPHLSRA